LQHRKVFRAAIFVNLKLQKRVASANFGVALRNRTQYQLGSGFISSEICL